MTDDETKSALVPLLPVARLKRREQPTGASRFLPNAPETASFAGAGILVGTVAGLPLTGNPWHDVVFGVSAVAAGVSVASGGTDWFRRVWRRKG